MIVAYLPFSVKAAVSDLRTKTRVRHTISVGEWLEVKMQFFSISCPSVTYAQKAQRVLEQAGIRSRMTRRSLFGCSYGLDVSAPSREETFLLLKRAGVPFTAQE